MPRNFMLDKAVIGYSLQTMFVSFVGLFLVLYKMFHSVLSLHVSLLFTLPFPFWSLPRN